MKPQKTRVTKKTKLLIQLLSAGVLLAILLTLLKIRQNTNIANFVTLNISKHIVQAMGKITSLVPFSVFELFVIFVIVYGIILLISLIRLLIKKKFFKATKKVLTASILALSIFSVYILSAGFAYYRDPVQIPQSSVTYNYKQAKEITDFFLADLNELNQSLSRDKDGNVLSPYTYKELNALLQEEFKRLDDNPYFYKSTPKVKKLVNSWFMSSTDYSGVAFLPLGEPNINAHTPKSQLVQVMAHEIAHTKGVMRESEANLVSDYILLTSQNDYLRYCGYFSTYYDLAVIVALASGYNEEAIDYTWNQLPQAFLNENTNAYTFWSNYRGPFDFLGEWVTQIGDKFNNWHLKFNGADDGMGSYYDDDYTTTPSDEIDPETETPIYTPTYSTHHKLLFAIYELSRDGSIK